MTNRKNSKSKPVTSRLDKVNEASVLFLFHSLSFTCGLCYLSNKTWFYDVEDCWKDYPYQPIPDDLMLYYIGQIGYFIYTLVMDAMKTEEGYFHYWLNLIHHVLAIVLGSMLWCSQAHRFGSLGLLIANATDAPVALSKALHYAGQRTAANVSLLIATLIWCSLRLGIFLFVLWPSFFSNPSQRPQSFLVIKFILVLMLTFTFIWAWFLLKLLYGSLCTKKVQLDDVACKKDKEGVLNEVDHLNSKSYLSHFQNVAVHQKEA